MKLNKLMSFLLLTLLLACAAPAALAQSDRGTLTGTVTDPTGAVVANAKVTATNLDTGEVRTVTTSDEGNYTMPELSADPYRVTVEATGFKTATMERVQVAVQVTRSADFTLEIGTVGDVVTVTGENAPVIQTENAVRQTNITERQVRELPLAVSAESGGRTPLSFIFLDSNVVSATGTTGRGTDAGNFRVSGGQGQGTEILIDGGGTRRGQNPTFFSEVAPGPNAFQEFTISTSGYSAEFGNSAGGIVNLTVKSGSNELHGEAYDLIRNEAFNANSFLNNSRGSDAAGNPNFPRPRDHQHNFGFNLGAPITLPHFGEGGPYFHSGRNKAFFFFNYEGYRFSQNETVDLTVPTNRMRQGDFGELLTDPYVLGFFGGPVRIYDPRQPINARTPITNNDLRAYQGGALIDPAGLAIMNAYPNPTSPGVFRNYRAVSSRPTTMNNYVGKVDYILSETQRLGFSYSFRKLDSIKGGFPRFPEPFIAADRWSQFFKSHYARAQYDWSISPTLLNHFNASFTRSEVANRNTTEGFTTSSLGIPANATQNVAFPRVLIFDAGDTERLTNPDPRAYQQIGSTFFSDNIGDNAVQLSDFVTYVRGRHNLKFGADVRWQQLNVHQLIDPGGTLTFSHLQTASDGDPRSGWPIASLAAGATQNSFAGIRSIDPGWRYFTPAFFVNDDFKVTPRLTVNLGVRYEIPYPRTEARDRYRTFDPDTPNPAAGGRRGALVGAGGQGGLNAQYEGLAKPDYSNIGPRVGFAYSLNDKTVVRGGYGLYYAPIAYNDINQGTIGYSTNRGEGPLGDQRPRFFLRNMPPAFPVDPGGQFIGSGSDVDYIQKDFKTGRTAQFSVDLQRQLPYNFAVSIGYIGSRGNRLRSNFTRLNAIPFEALRLGQPLLTTDLAAALANPAAVAYASSVGVALPSSPNAVYPGFQGTVAQALRPFPQYRNINNQLESQGRSWYNAMQVKLDRRFSQGIQFGAAYTFSKLITNAAEDLLGASPIGGVQQNPFDRESLRTVSPNHPYHVAVFNYIIELPFGKGRRFLNGGGALDKLVGGWQINGIQRYQSGLPLTVFTDRNVFFLRDVTGYLGNLRPNLTGQPILLDNDPSGTSFRVINPAAFSQPPDFGAPPTTDVSSPAYAAYYANPARFFGNAPPVLDRARALPFYSENLSLLKKTSLTETITLELGAEAFNVFNRHRYFGPETNFANTGGFGFSGVVDNAEVYAPRVVQIRARVFF
jgi:hypothetical protein